MEFVEVVEPLISTNSSNLPLGEECGGAYIRCAVRCDPAICRPRYVSPPGGRLLRLALGIRRASWPIVRSDRRAEPRPISIPWGSNRADPIAFRIVRRDLVPSEPRAMRTRAGANAEVQYSSPSFQDEDVAPTRTDKPFHTVRLQSLVFANLF